MRRVVRVERLKGETGRTKITVKLNLGIGEAEFPIHWPPRIAARGAWRVLAIAVPSVGVAVAAVYFIWIHGPMADARHYMRIARYDLADKAIARVPKQLEWWPGVAFAKEKASVGAELSSRTDREHAGKQLGDMIRRAPGDADVLVLQAVESLNKATSATVVDTVLAELENLKQYASSALKVDSEYAEAWYVRGLAHDIVGLRDDAVSDYERAAKSGPDSPHYGSNYARALLDQGKTDAAIRQYGNPMFHTFPLARVEGALAYWAQGDMLKAAAWQEDALKMMGDPQTAKQFYNARSWIFRLPTEGVELVPVEDKLCYARLGLAVSEYLGKASAKFTPRPCNSRPGGDLARKLVAHDVCRYAAAGTQYRKGVGQVRVALGQPRDCPPEGG